MTEDELARRGLRALLGGHLVLSKEEAERLIGVLLGGPDRGLVHAEFTYARVNGQPRLIRARHSVDPWPVLYTPAPIEFDLALGAPPVSDNLGHGVITSLTPRHAVNGHNGERICGAECGGCE